MFIELYFFQEFRCLYSFCLRKSSLPSIYVEVPKILTTLPKECFAAPNAFAWYLLGLQARNGSITLIKMEILDSFSVSSVRSHVSMLLGGILLWCFVKHNTFQQTFQPHSENLSQQFLWDFSIFDLFPALACFYRRVDARHKTQTRDVINYPLILFLASFCWQTTIIRSI